MSVPTHPKLEAESGDDEDCEHPDDRERRAAGIDQRQRDSPDAEQRSRGDDDLARPCLVSEAAPSTAI